MDFRIKYRRNRATKEEKANEQREQTDTLKRMRGLAIGMSIPMSLIAGPVGGWLIGAFLDRTYGTSHWLPILILAGTAAGIWAVIEMLLKLGRN